MVVKPVKIEFELPKWAVGRNIHIMAGTELLGRMEFRREKNRINGKVEIKEYYLPLKLKPENGRCIGCGDCCSMGGSFASKGLLDEISKRLSNYEYSKKGACPLLGDIGCIMGSKIPFSCLRSNCEEWSENCTEKLIELEVR